MALTKKKKGFGDEEDELELGSVRFTRGLGRKRILISNRVCNSSLSTSAVQIPVKKQRSTTIDSEDDKSRLESLPQDLLIRVICGVDHDDLNSLNVVSKSVREACLLAKGLHFAYTTPKKTQAFRNTINLMDISNLSHLEDDGTEAPNAPVHYRWTKAKREDELASISVALFT